MDSINIPSDQVPPELKSCEQILKRGKELRKAEPVVAYWCCFSAAQKALKMKNRSAEGTRFLMSLLDALEEMKAIIGTHEAVANEAAGAAYIENFALKVFMSADNADRAGNTGKDTIRKFVVAGQFIDVLRSFENGMTEEMEQKLQYARWKAADGAKALREWRVPVSGPPLPESEINPFPELPTGSPGTASTVLQASPRLARGSFSSLNRPIVPPPQGGGASASPSSSTPIISPRPSPAQLPRANLPGLDTSSRESLTPRNPMYASGEWSTIATPGVPEDENDERAFDLPSDATATASSSSFPSIPTPAGGSDGPEPRSPLGGDKKNVRFMGPDGAPLSPAHTFVTLDSVDEPAAPPPTTFSPSPTEYKSYHPNIPPPPPAPVPRSNGSTPTTTTSTSSGPGAGAGASYPSVPPPVPHPNGLGLSSAPAPAPPPKPSAPPTRKQIDETKKHARWAISALEFDDVPTARLELQKALALIGG